MVAIQATSGAHLIFLGRYIVSQPHVMRTVDIVRGRRERFQGIVVPDGAQVPLTINIDSSKVRNTAWLHADTLKSLQRSALLQTIVSAGHHAETLVHKDTGSGRVASVPVTLDVCCGRCPGSSG